MRKGRSNAKSRILQFIYNYGETSKQQISNELGLSMPTILMHTKKLISAGLIMEGGLFSSTGGRKAGILTGVPRVRIAVGVDITANHIGFVLVDLSGRAIFHERISRQFETSETYNRRLGDDIRRILKGEEVHSDSILGIGVSLPGIFDPIGTKLEYSHALGLRNYSCEGFSLSVEYPCIFENDANAAGMAEFRVFPERDPMAYLSLSNSVGGAFFPDNSLYPGINRRSSEFGHMCMVPNGRKCYCGKDGCTDAYCSATLLSKPFNDRLQTFFDELDGNNPKALKLWDEYTDSLALCANNLRMIFDCNIVLGGYVGGYIGKHLLSDIKSKASCLNTFEASGDYLMPCKYKQEAAAIGAALKWIDLFIDSII